MAELGGVMDPNIIGLLLSYAFVFAVLALAQVLLYGLKVPVFYLRKLVHIGVSHWWLVAVVYFSQPIYPMIGALSFVFINYISYKRKIFQAMELSPGEDGEGNLGTVYFPVSLAVVVLTTFGGPVPMYVGTMAILVMGYGDGMAAIVGKLSKGLAWNFSWGYKKKKSLLGSSAIFGITFVLVYGISLGAGQLALEPALILAVIVTLVEAYTPWGLDNLTVPVAVLMVYYLFFVVGLLELISWSQLAWALGLNLALAAAARWKRSVSVSGFWSGLAVGSIIYYSGGVFAWMVLGTFFVSSSLLSRYKKEKKQPGESRGAERDWVQVSANSSVAVVAIMLFAWFQNPLYLFAFAASFAASNADTWASEIGALSPKTPYSIITWQPVPRGQSGGVSLLGIGASLGGAFVIAGIYLTAPWFLSVSFAWVYSTFPLVVLAGFAGALVDSFLGAGLQARYLCYETGRWVESPSKNGLQLVRVDGLFFLNNDMVNLVSNFAAVGLALLFFFLSSNFFR